MRIIYKKRRGGKTTDLIKESAEKNIYILVANRNSARCVFEQAREMGLSIPFPVTVEEYFRSGGFRGSFIKNILIDDADIVLRTIFSNVQIDCISITKKESEE